MARRGLCAALLACVASAAPFVSRGDVVSRGWREAIDREVAIFIAHAIEGASVAIIFARRSGPRITRAQRLISAQEGSLRHELPYSGEFQRERADLLNHMKAVCRRAPSL